MTEEVRTPSPGFRVGPTVALLLSALVLPGLGQLLTGRLLKGALMAGGVTLWLPVALFKLFRDLEKVLPDLIQLADDGGRPGLAEMQAALQPLSGGMTWIFLPLMVIWFWSFSDSLIYLFQSKGKRRP